MKRFKKIFLISSIFLMAFDFASAQMSDKQVIEFIKEAKAAGKGEKELGRELLARGVTREQIARIKEKYEQQNIGTNVTNSFDGTDSRTRKNSEDPLSPIGIFDITTEGVVDSTKIDTRNIVNIFGHNIFKSSTLTFEPNENIATPVNYRLGPGDEIIIDIWGVNEVSLRQEITPEGVIMVSQVGPIYLSGLTIEEASTKIKEMLASKYSSVSGDEPESQISVTLGKARTILINVMGEVTAPGTYRLSSFSTVFHALYRAGGVSDIGTLRNIKVVRNNMEIATIDAYKIIMSGQMNDDIRLQEGDVILVSPFELLVNIQGKIKRPMFYEMKHGESLSQLINFSGGFTGDAYKDEVRLVRRTGKEKQIYSVTENNYSGWQVADGDSIIVSEILDRYANRIEIRGAVYRPGIYELSKSLATVKDLVNRAEGLTGDAFTDRAILTREREDLTKEVIPVDLTGIINGKVPDIPLKREDILVISSKNELQALGTFSIYGEVTRPGIFPYAENTTLEDLIIQAGGLLDGASTVRVDVSRRIKNPKSTSSSADLSKTFTLSIKDGYIVDGTPGFKLEPYDIVEVRRSPGYQIQRRVTIGGEAIYNGGYTLTKKNERLSDLVKRAGGLTQDAYIRGGRLIRQMNTEEKAQQEAAIRMAMMNSGSDSLSVNKIEVPEHYVVGIELDKALKNPGSDYDVVLREGDYLFIPEYMSTVRITGEVQYPNTVSYMKGKPISYYIEQAGGYSRLAKKNNIYIVHVNGTVSKVKRFKKAEIEPGCQIIVPSKKERQPLRLPEIMAIGTSAVSLGTMAATLYNLFK